jgi:hypothetical protein
MYSLLVAHTQIPSFGVLQKFPSVFGGHLQVLNNASHLVCTRCKRPLVDIRFLLPLSLPHDLHMFICSS